MLEKYHEKRDFQRTPEPAPAPLRKDDEEGPLTFVIQKHAASRLHYDFRLEIDGVLKSWPVPKGPSLDPQDKRLAVMVEDHPLDYASFEGVIPKGEYGAGQVIVWDAGTYSPDEGGKLSFHDREEANARIREELENGKLSFFLRGHKLKGSWTLVKTKQGDSDWLLIKHKDAFVDAERDLLDEDASVISGLTIADIKAGRLPDRREARFVLRPGDAKGARRADFPGSVEPMLATLTERPFSSHDWFFEPKLDGVRCLAMIDSGDVKLLSRRGLVTTRSYPALTGELKTAQVEPQMVLDGEIVALDESGVPSFQLLQQRINLTRESDITRAEAEVPVIYYVYDLLHAGGYDLRGSPLRERKALLKQLLIPSNRVQPVDHFEAEGEAAYEAAVEHGLEGVVAKRRDSVYESGRRSQSWLKIKATLTDEFVIGGYSAGDGSRSKTFGALLVGQYDDEGKLVYAGHVGSGFSDRMLHDLLDRLSEMKEDRCPFSEEPSRSAQPFGRRGGRREAETVWVRPELVARVKFAQRTADGVLRAPVFQGLVGDREPGAVHREEVAPVPADSAPRKSPGGEGDVATVLDQLEKARDKATLKASGQNVPVTNLDKELWPAHGKVRALTKRALLAYLARVSPYLLPHLKDRPITLTRYPDGITGEHFYQKRWESKLPGFVKTVELFSSHNEGDVEYLLCNNLPTLLWLGQLADIELHTWYSRVDPGPDAGDLPAEFTGSDENIGRSLLNYPDFVVFDLDPYIYSGKEGKGDEPELNRRAFRKTVEVAFWLKEVLDSLSLSSFVKTTGKTGLHIYVPILRNLEYGAVRAACETIGRFIMQAHPREVTMEWQVSKRTGKVFFDHNQNVRGKTLACVYSPRPSPEAAVSMPVRWDELKDIYPTDFTILSACDRLAETGDLWSGILGQKHNLRALLDEIPEAD